MHNRKHSPAKILIKSSLCSIFLLTFFASQVLATGGTGIGGHTEIPRPNLLAGYGFSCNYAGIVGDPEGDDYKYNCPHWIKAPMSVFEYVYNNRGGKYPSTRRTTVHEQDVLNTCLDPSKNTDGIIYFSGYYGVDSPMNIQNLLFLNHADDWINSWKRDRLDLSFSVNGNGEVIGGNFFDAETMDIYNSVLSMPGRTPHNLAMFCSALTDRRVPFEGSYQSQTRTKINNSNWSNWNNNSADYYIQDSNNDTNKIYTTFYFQHLLKSSLERETSPNWVISRSSSQIGAGRINVRNSFLEVGSMRSPQISQSISLGNSQKFCQTVTHPAGVRGVDLYRADKFIRNERTEYYGSANSSSCATANHPYDFTTSASTNPVNTILYIGETIQASGSVKNSSTHDNNNATPHTITPSDTVSRLFQFTVNANVTANNNKLAGGTTSSDPCEFFRNKLGAGNVTCNGNLKSETTSIANGATKNLSGTINVPDNASFLGKKICVATAISYADSGSGYNGGLNKKWRISGASCSTIAKRPNFQVWGGVSTRGSINTAYSSKSGRTYGSWAEHLVVAGGVVNRFGSGASLGYATGSYNLGLPGGKNGTNPNTKDISLLTVSNSGNAIGKSNITTSSQLIESLKTRFSGASAGVEFTNSAAEFDGKIERLSGTKVYKINDNVTIKNDICYGKCNDSPTKLESYNLSSNQPATIPQIIIFAKNIKINENVKRIDAWLISDNDIDTCNGHAVGNNNLSSSSCKETLIINGPVFAKSIQLKRTAGAESGNGIQEAGNVLMQDISNDGSIAPAEVFNLRGDAYIWSHMQAKRSNEAVTVYTRELAPRL